jgi:hypothetical protein
MSGKDKIEKDYKEYEKNIEEKTEEEIAQIREKASEIKAEAEKIADSVEIFINQNKEKGHKKKS